MPRANQLFTRVDDFQFSLTPSRVIASLLTKISPRNLNVATRAMNFFNRDFYDSYNLYCKVSPDFVELNDTERD